MQPELITLRPSKPEDQEFLKLVYATTRYDELANLGWSEEQKQRFIDMQFYAQDTQYRDNYPRANFDIVQYQGEDVGRLYTEETNKEIRIMEITVLPRLRGKGIGGVLMQRVIDEADSKGKETSLHVEKHNPSQRLFKRLGFRFVEDRSVYQFLIRPCTSKGNDNQDKA